MLALLVSFSSFSSSFDDELQARSQYSEGSVIDHLDTGFSWYTCA